MCRGLLTAMAVGVLTSCGAASDPPTSEGGRVIWRVATPEGPTRDPASADGVAFFEGPSEHSMVAIEGRTGHVLWKTIAPGGPRPLEGRNVVVAGPVVAMGDASVYAFDRTTGQLRWIFEGPAGDGPGLHRLAGDENTIYAASFAGRVHAIDALTGAARWSIDLTEGQAETAAFDPTVAGNELYVGTKHFETPVRGSFYALEAATGVVRWRYDFTPEFPNLYAGCFGHALVVGNAVIVGQEDGRIYAFERSSGHLKWMASAAREGGASRFTDNRFFAAAGDDLIATSEGGTISLLDGGSGATRWSTKPVAATIISPPAVLNGKVYVSHAGVFAAYSIATGALAWTDPERPGTRPADFFGQPIVDNDRIYMPGPTAFYAIRP